MGRPREFSADVVSRSAVLEVTLGDWSLRGGWRAGCADLRLRAGAAFEHENAGPAHLPHPLLHALDHADDCGQRLVALDPQPGPRSPERAARTDRTSACSVAHQRNARAPDADPDES